MDIQLAGAPQDYCCEYRSMDEEAACVDDVEEDTEEATTASQALQGKDIQGIQWQMNWTRARYRLSRLEAYKNIANPNPQGELLEEGTPVVKDGTFYAFRYNTRRVKSTVVHFQLRNLVWATSRHDVYVMHQSSINHWSPLTGKVTEVLNLAGAPPSVGAAWGLPSPARVQISTMAVKSGLVVAGGFRGEMVCKRLDSPGIAHSCRITQSDNAITNAVEIFESESGAIQIMASNNDRMVRVFDCQTFEVLNRFDFPWAVNHTTVSPDKKLLCVVGDDYNGLLADSHNGKVVATLRGHVDFSFSSAWHPDGRVFATGNQDATCRLWDVRYLSKSLALLKGKIGAVRALRYSSDGRFLAMSEPCDFVQIYDCHQDYQRAQEIDLFGEVAGISFSPDGEAFFLSIADRNIGSLLEYTRNRPIMRGRHYQPLV